jgi:hypothetical protein
MAGKSSHPQSNKRKKENKMKNKKTKKPQNKSESVQILRKTKTQTSLEASDERLFKFIKKEVPDVQENSFYEFNFYTIADTKDKAAKCAALITQGIENTTKHLAQVNSSDEYGVVIFFIDFPFNLDEIKKCSKFFDDCANKTGCVYDSWEIGIPGDKLS